MMKPDQKLVIHFFEQIDKLNGKMGHAVLRYSRNPVACAVDFNHKGFTTRACRGSCQAGCPGRGDSSVAHQGR